MFVLEMAIYFLVKSDFSKGILSVKGYAFSFFFWLDLLAVLAMVPDVGWLASNGFSPLDSLAAMAGKISGKSSPVLRMARLVRLLKLYKVTSQRSLEMQQFDGIKKIVESGHFSHDEIQEFLEKSNSQKQSKVGAKLSERITRRVILGVLLMLLIIPLLTYSSSVDDENEATYFLHDLNIKAGLNCDYLGRSISNFRSIMDQLGGDKPFLVALKVSPPRCEGIVPMNFSNDDIIGGMRDDELRTISTDPIMVDGKEYSLSASFNMKPYIDQQSIFSIGLLVFVMIMLVVLSHQFTGDAQRLVLSPIESMTAIVNMVAADPLEDFDFKSMPGTGDYETHIVQQAIEKITALLRIGFGVAGAEIISSNMAVEGNGSACLNPMIPGKRVYAVFGFCDIHSFDKVTEILEDEIMTFINSVARIVHGEVSRWGGTCNKNLGNSFLMVWRIGDENALSDYGGFGKRSAERRNSESSNKSDDYDSARPANSRANVKAVKRSTIDLSRIPGLDLLSDKALIGFLKVIIEVNRDVQLLAYRDDKRLSKGKENGFSVRMGFGLHAGWAIEGAVGSFHKLLSEPAQKQCRKVDVVTVKGSNVPMPIYTYDTFQNQVFPQLRAPKFSALTLQEILTRQAENYDTSAWMSDPDLIQLRCLTTPIFWKTFEKGVENYLGGHWEEARENLEKADMMMASNDTGGDGPSRAILKYMKSNDWICPPSWSGHRPLTTK
ncbi:hypothetical protein ACHAXA_002013 [Cyclostephanos tholiformis]|uniref:Guanylate cyclase domain-containing protein n=1 Tax=Cyclostephanos tholiformis TaxID=382380 RepID=A0ABD3RZM9_9STRA